MRTHEFNRLSELLNAGYQTGPVVFRQMLAQASGRNEATIPNGSESETLVTLAHCFRIGLTVGFDKFAAANLSTKHSD